jgi:wee1-like protein kinase
MNTRFVQDFEDLAVLGKGAFGRVHQCRNRMDGCTYAVKRLMRKMIGDGRKKDQLREVLALSALQANGDCPASIVRYYSSWVEDGFLHIQTEYCARGNLHAQMTNQGRVLDSGTLIRLCLEMAQAFEYIHGRHMVHLDCKPENILETADGTFKLSDFGLALPTTGPNSPAARGVLEFEGDRRYLAREVLQGDNLTQLPKGDMFALGLTLYELAKGEPLPSNGPLWDQLRYGVIQPCARLPEEGLLFMLIRSLINVNPLDRPSASEVVAFIRASSTTPSSPSPTSSSSASSSVGSQPSPSSTPPLPAQTTMAIACSPAPLAVAESNFRSPTPCSSL